MTAVQGAAGSSEYERTKSRAVAGGRVFLLRYAVVGFLSLIGSTVLIRMLGPPAWAAFSVAYYLVVFLDQTFAPKLLGGLIQSVDEPTREDIEAASRLMQLCGVMCLLLFAAVSYPAGLLYGDLELTLCLLAVAVCAYVYAVRSTSVALLERELGYKRIAIADVVDQLTFYAVAVPAVAAGAGLAGAAIGLCVRGVVAAALLRRWAPAPFLGRRLRAQIKRLLRFGLPSIAASSIFLVDGLVPLLVLGSDYAVELAFTMVAGTIVGYAATAQVVAQRVGFPSLSMLQQDPVRFREALHRIMGLGSFVIVSAVVPLAASSPLWLPVLLGDEWREASLVMIAIGAGLILNSFHSGASTALSSLGHPKWALGLQATMTSTYFVLALALVPHSALLGCAIAWALSRGIGAIVSYAALAAKHYPTPATREAAVLLTGITAMVWIGGLLYEDHVLLGAASAVGLTGIWVVCTRGRMRLAWRVFTGSGRGRLPA